MEGIVHHLGKGTNEETDYRVQIETVPDYLSNEEVKELISQGKPPLITFVCDLRTAYKLLPYLKEFFIRKLLQCIRVDGYVKGTPDDN